MSVTLIVLESQVEKNVEGYNRINVYTISPRTADGLTYIGCFEDVRKDRAMSGGFLTSLSMTNEVSGRRLGPHHDKQDIGH